MAQALTIFWFRRDLRLHDNHGLFQALRSEYPVQPVFIFDREILDDLEEKRDRRVAFIHAALAAMQEQLVKNGASLDVRYGRPIEVWKQLLEDYPVKAVYFNHDYEPYARRRDGAVLELLTSKGIELHSFKDQVIFERKEVVKDNGEPYGVFTPFSRKWKARLGAASLEIYPAEKLQDRFYQRKALPLPSLESMGFEPLALDPVPVVDLRTVQEYDKKRDLPAIAGTTRLGIHFRFGTVSVRNWVESARQLNETFLNELIWREFFMQLLWHHPRLEREACKKEYDRIEWRNNPEEFEAWFAGKTGYPLVDAGIRELNATGFMHNRVRMVVASFLVKHLLIDWRWGEAYFARRLDDYELAANNGNWQWVAGCGCDAAPYFRIFNPAAQAKRFDPKGEYIRRWVPEIDTPEYPQPIVVHEFARDRCLRVYKAALNSPSPLER